MAQRRGSSTEWTTYEVYQRNGQGEYAITPVSAALAISGTMPIQAINKMRMLQDLGFPTAKRDLTDDCGHPLIVKKDEVIWLLKCKPSCWRLYFYVWKNEKENRIIYVHAVCKKTDAEKPRDAIEARRVYGGIRPGGSGITAFEFPVG